MFRARWVVFQRVIIMVGVRMIDIVRIIDKCSVFVGSKMYVKTHVENDVLHVEFEWPSFSGRKILTRLYTRDMVNGYEGDLSKCIIDDFRHQTRGVS